MLELASVRYVLLSLESPLFMPSTALITAVNEATAVVQAAIIVGEVGEGFPGDAVTAVTGPIFIASRLVLVSVAAVFI